MREGNVFSRTCLPVCPYSMIHWNRVNPYESPKRPSRKDLSRRGPPTTLPPSNWSDPIPAQSEEVLCMGSGCYVSFSKAFICLLQYSSFIRKLICYFYFLRHGHAVHRYRLPLSSNISQTLRLKTRNFINLLILRTIDCYCRSDTEVQGLVWEILERFRSSGENVVIVTR